MNEIQKAQQKWEAQECRLMGWPTPEEIASRKASIQRGWSPTQRKAHIVQKPPPVEVMRFSIPDNGYSPGII